MSRLFFPNSKESSTVEGLWLMSGLASRFFAGKESAGVGKIPSGHPADRKICENLLHGDRILDHSSIQVQVFFCITYIRFDHVLSSLRVDSILTHAQ